MRKAVGWGYLSCLVFIAKSGGGGSSERAGTIASKRDIEEKEKKTPLNCLGESFRDCCRRRET